MILKSAALGLFVACSLIAACSYRMPPSDPREAARLEPRGLVSDYQARIIALQSQLAAQLGKHDAGTEASAASPPQAPITGTEADRASDPEPPLEISEDDEIVITGSRIRTGFDDARPAQNQRQAEQHVSKCDHGAELRERICELSRRICDIAGRKVSDQELAGKCAAARKACQRAQQDVAHACP